MSLAPIMIFTGIETLLYCSAICLASIYRATQLQNEPSGKQNSLKAMG